MLRCAELRVNYPPRQQQELPLKEASGTAETRGGADIYSVSQLNRKARNLLEAGLPNLWVAGEISNLAQPGSGHIYFSLKDAGAQVSCAMFKGANARLRFKPKNGDQVLLQGRVSIYEPRGSYQLIVAKMEEAGEGLLRRKFEELKARLNAEGLFDESLKQPLPKLPSRIGVVTSPTGAAIRDILHILARRYPLASIIIYPTRVQGEGARDEIVSAIEVATQRNECDVLIVSRGGGSLEDLWCFNEEAVARAIHACPLPIVSGVGHEVDFTIADLVADIRAPTPSGAAELITPDSNELLRNLQTLDRRVSLSMKRHWSAWQQHHAQLLARLKRSHPGAVLRQLQQRADELTRQLGAAMQTGILKRQFQLQELRQLLRNAAPAERLASKAGSLTTLELRLGNATRQRLQAAQTRFSIVAGALNAVSPLATLERGYAIVQTAEKGQVLRDTANIKAGDRIEARLAKGQINATVDSVIASSNNRKN
jgi:exodeoxyribonuclease VII large subunit